MTYVVSDIHGEFEKYRKMLEIINFSDDDTLYVLGDIIDRGEHPCAVLRDMMSRPNVIPMLGNHEMMAVRLLRLLCTEITEENAESQLDGDDIGALMLWNFNGGQTTLEDFRSLPQEMRLTMIEYFEEFSAWEEVSINGNSFLLVHGGIPKDKLDAPIDDFSLPELLNERVDYSMRYFENKYLVTGHTPTMIVGREYKGKILKKNGHIAIDCGAVFGNPLGCIRLDDLAEFYAF